MQGAIPSFSSADFREIGLFWTPSAGHNPKMDRESVKLDRWGYEVNTTSDACIAAINSYYEQVSLEVWFLEILTYFLLLLVWMKIYMSNMN